MKSSNFGLPMRISHCYIALEMRGPYPRASHFDAGWSSPVARQAHNLKVVGSNPTPATNMSARLSPGQTGAKSSLRERCPRECGDPDPRVKPAGARFSKPRFARQEKVDDPTPATKHAAQSTTWRRFDLWHMRGE